MSPTDLAGLSDDLLFASVLLYALAMLGFAGEQASRRSVRVVSRTMRCTTRLRGRCGRRAARCDCGRMVRTPSSPSKAPPNPM